ncbi:MAG: NitT/TauT family transport system substrate-binding protein [Saprospiraceae bacterium]|jgi:NitT/TauT family transport system substrate-binding protein
MARRLTTFSKFLITLLIVAALFFAGKYFLENTEVGRNLTKQANTTSTDVDKPSSGTNTSTSKNDKEVIKVGVVTWGGYAGGQYFNEGFQANTRSRFYKDYGFKVEFKILDDFEASRAAFKNDEVNLLWATIDAFPTEVESLKPYKPKVVFQADWSRGGDAIVSRRGINTVADLKGKKIAVAELTPSHSFLLWLLDAGGLSINDVTLVKQASAIDAAAAFKANQVDAAVVWSPDDADCVASVPGSRVLENTKSASHIIADVFIAKEDFINNNQERMQQLYEGWMKGAAEINSNDGNKRKASKILAEAFDGFDEEMTYDAINNVRLCTHGDNLNFFGLNKEYRNVTGESLYAKMTNVYGALGFTGGKVPNWRLIQYSKLAQNATALSSLSEHASEGQKTFAAVKESDKTKASIATKAVSINFPTGAYKLDENSKYIIDNEFVEIAKAFSNSRIRIEGNTDSTGSAATNKSLSQKRAQSVANYLIQTYGMPRNRFIVVGNGPDKPVASNNDEAGRAKNRRTDFELVPE